MPELVGLVLSQVDHRSLVACRFVCTTWTRVSPPPLPPPPQREYETCTYAARGGHLKLLQWARANGAPWTARTCAYAARGGHLDVLQWAQASGCPWDELTCALAAKGGHLEVLQWARTNGCPWSKQTCSSAAEGGHLDVLQRLPVGLVDMCSGSQGRPYRRAPVGARQWLPLGCGSGPVLRRPGEAISRCSSGRGPTAVPGTRRRVPLPPQEAISRCSSGRAPTAARGTGGRVKAKGGIPRCSSGRANGCPWTMISGEIWVHSSWNAKLTGKQRNLNAK
jgi:hypothetical protein